MVKSYMRRNGSNLSINLSAVVYREDRLWLAHCLELDIVAEGDSVEEAVRSLVSLCDLQIKTAIEESDLQSIFRPAPAEIWKLFTVARKKHVHSASAFKTPVHRFETRQLAVA